MSMIGNVCAVSPSQLQSLIDSPDSIKAFLYPDDGDSEPDNHVDLDKAWHAIHFTLTGSAWEGEEPLKNALFGGVEIGDDIGYGAARYLIPEQVKSVATALDSITEDDFAQNFDSHALAAAEIYPTIWDREDASESLEFVQPYYSALRSFYRKASNRGDAVLVYLN